MNGLSKNAIANRTAIADIRRRMMMGELTPEQAKAEAAPIVARINASGAEIAKKYGRKFKPFSFAYLMRTV
jgi:hypothetical protein